MLKRLILAGAAVALGAAAPAGAQTVLKFGHVGAPGSLFEISVNEFARCANEALAGEVEVQTFGSSQLGKDQELLQKLKLGQVDFSLPSSVMSSVADEFGVFEMPYIIRDREHMRRVQGELMDSVFQPAVQEQGYRIIGLFENGFRHITNNVRPISTPEDLAGIKLRTPKGAWRVKMFQLYGANPTPMAFSDVFTALQTDVIDGQENPYAQIWSAKFQEVQKYLSITGHVYTPAYVLVAESTFSSWPENVQAALTTCGTETQDFVYDEAARLEQELLQNLKDGGIEVNEADKDAFVEASAPIYEEFASSMDGGQDLIDRVNALAAGQ